MNDYEQVGAPQRAPRTDSSCAPAPRARADKSPAGKDRAQVARQAMSIKEFCAAHGIGRTTFYKLRKAGLAPRLMVVGGRMRISAEAAEAWRREREEAARQPACGATTTTPVDHAHAGGME
jgi:excisionase family DNA binding protein